MPTPRKPGVPVAQPTAGSDAPQKFRAKIFGVGGAGCNALPHIARASLTGVELIAVNTDSQALAGMTVAEKLQIGSVVTHGLGAGGDCEVGARAALQDAERLEAAMHGADIVFISAGLGGGTGGGASPVLARLAKSQGALVLAIVTTPFSFEGERRRQQAHTSLEQLKAQADAVICIPNDKLFKLVGESASAVEAFKRGDEVVATGVQAIWQLLAHKGLVNLDFADLRSILGSKHCEGILGHGEGKGAEKARDAVKSLMDSPLFDNEALGRADGVLVSILGGPDLTLTDVQKTVEPFSRAASRAHIIMGAAVDEAFRGRLAVTAIVAANVVPKRAIPSPLNRPAVVRQPVPAHPNPAPVAAVKPVPQAVEPATAPKKKATQPKQETLPLEGVTRGRFDKSEPTLYDGEDLDVPTYLRRGVSLKR
ncbi:MAG TPA: cell division protein FtsZ [Verrucomicrobiae bacterium]|nr:cell division protein FtsZ [Verrucomicrobiae bacterium]